MTNQTIDIIIPTMDNTDQLMQCIGSILRNYTYFPVRVIVVNNGHPDTTKHGFFDSPHIKVLYPDHNLGWEGGLELGLKESKSEFVVFMNDDTFVPECSKFWLRDMLQVFRSDEVGAVGPSSNVVMGKQNIFTDQERTFSGHYQVPFLIGFCVVLRRKALDEAGGIDVELNGGDDIDLSIRLQDAGYILAMDRSVFVYHHGFQTGTRVHGDHTTPGGWNSQDMTDRTNIGLIKKHGLKRWYEGLYSHYDAVIEPEVDIEGDIVRSYIVGDKVVDLGCGGNKTIPTAIGVDEIAKGDQIPMLVGKHSVSEADVVADVTKKLPFKDKEFDTLIARHILEHISDPVKVLKEWSRIAERLIITVPNQEECSVIPLNPEHLHAWSPDTLASIAELVGLRVVESKVHYNGISFTIVLERDHEW